MATTARGGVAAAVDGQPALILLDNRLPDATGGDVLRQLASSAAAGIPVVVISGDSGQGSVDGFLAAGAADFLPKPFDIHRFSDVINRYLPPPADATARLRPPVPDAPGGRDLPTAGVGAGPWRGLRRLRHHGGQSAASRPRHGRSPAW